jgi:hypothetical protein
MSSANGADIRALDPEPATLIGMGSRFPPDVRSQPDYLRPLMDGTGAKPGNQRNNRRQKAACMNKSVSYAFNVGSPESVTTFLAAAAGQRTSGGSQL